MNMTRGESNLYNEFDLDKIDIHAEPPAGEPARQYYFMAKCREWTKSFEQKNGRVPTACVTTFGCQMNARDSEKLRGILKEMGYEEASEEKADFVIYNTCTVRENANTRVYGRLGQLKPRKKKHPHMMIGLCGCMMQEPEVVEKLKKSPGCPGTQILSLGPIISINSPSWSQRALCQSGW